MWMISLTGSDAWGYPVVGGLCVARPLRSTPLAVVARLEEEVGPH